MTLSESGKQDDIAIGLGRPLFGSSVHHTKKKAYPNVITTLGQMMPEARKFLALNNFMCRSPTLFLLQCCHLLLNIPNQKTTRGVLTSNK